MWGSPRFWNSIVCTNPPTLPKRPSLISFSNASFFNSKTHATMSGWSAAVCFFPVGLSPSSFNSASCISGQLGLAIIVRKMSGFLQKWQMAIESWKSWYIWCRLPVWLEGKIILWPSSDISVSCPGWAAWSRSPWYTSALSFFWWWWIQFNSLCSVDAHASTTYCCDNFPPLKIVVSSLGLWWSLYA